MSGYTIYCHPENLARLKSALEESSQPKRDSALALVIGDPIVASPLVPKRKSRREWQPPAWPFCTIEPSDHEWLRNLGFGTIVEIDEGPLFYRLKDFDLYAAPLPSLTTFLSGF